MFRRVTLALGLLGFALSGAVKADDHGDAPKALPMALWSTYEFPAGAKPSDVEASLVEYLKGEEKRGFNNCAMYKHEFGSLRGFYTTCTFDDIDHFARIMDGSPPATSPEESAVWQPHRPHCADDQAGYDQVDQVCGVCHDDVFT